MMKVSALFSRFTLFVFGCGFFLAMAMAAEPIVTNFVGSTLESQWSLASCNPDLPHDWSDYKFLTLEFKSSTAQRFDLNLVTADQKVRRVHILPFAGAWIRAAIPLAYFEKRDTQGFDLASLGNKSRVGYFINLTGQVGPLTDIEQIGVGMDHPIGAPTIEIRSVKVDRESPGDAVLEPKPLVDEFGQWMLEDWPGKAHSLEELKTAWVAEDGTLTPAFSQRAREKGSGLSQGEREKDSKSRARQQVETSNAFGYSRYGGFASTQAKATGFFHVEKINDRWWFVDPEGYLFFSTGADVMAPWMGTRTADRDGVFTALPPADLKPPSFRGGNQAGTVSFYTWNLLRRFGDDWQQKWIDNTLARMDAWGLNTVANWADPRLGAAQRKPYIVMLRGIGVQGGYLGLPDVYAEVFAKQIEAAVSEQCTPHKDDPWLLGCFIANEPPWPGREAEIVTAILDGPDAPIQQKAKDFLAAGDTPERRREFVDTAIVQFIDTVNAAMKKADPNHLNLGLRFGSRPTEAMLRASRGFDVFSMNSYRYEPDKAAVDAAYKITERPVLIGEFHFGTPGRGMAAGIVQAKNQEERGVAYRYYVEHAAAHPAIIGTHWFEWVDEPNTGRNDGEDYNIGMVDVTDQPYPEMVKAMQATHARLLDVHSGKEPPVERKALVQ
jgi:hypothetical protein